MAGASCYSGAWLAGDQEPHGGPRMALDNDHNGALHRELAILRSTKWSPPFLPPKQPRLFSVYPHLARNSLRSPGWPQTHNPSLPLPPGAGIKGTTLHTQLTNPFFSAPKPGEPGQRRLTALPLRAQQVAHGLCIASSQRQAGWPGLAFPGVNVWLSLPTSPQAASPVGSTWLSCPYLASSGFSSMSREVGNEQTEDEGQQARRHRSSGPPTSPSQGCTLACPHPCQESPSETRLPSNEEIELPPFQSSRGKKRTPPPVLSIILT
ncbi:uncharacterized protein [Dipodomys merriami]|uniref:uncharacterized protein n=1 Tax=Dipodomys merriami TaxID=94247 RepID=UPI0038557526